MKADARKAVLAALRQLRKEARTASASGPKGRYWAFGVNDAVAHIRLSLLKASRHA